ncbi:hypothetical protein M409DRAFT_58571 [Zasmidium cellare ATCC 36951]|uniref:Uncharacterized protein n=1 Tax=Zasmidium cellare ATCC 36951 TaxID=1080233 RepID=A0A6A6C7D9_ZASCE|nr:uncharacterized protein M409DRAFT_58571 [Zasmidium cellare ATCC 36951]KAF2162130.1 hypothetical protein M409DRAFT_58571 [Zasmidium cellare ATCC 36951]
MDLLKCIAMAIFLGHAAASPVSVTAIVTVIETFSKIPASASPSAIPSNSPVNMLLPAVTPVNHAIITNPNTRTYPSTETTNPVTCELLPCTTTAFWHYSPINREGCRSLTNMLYCDYFSTVSTTCLDQNHLPDCLYSSTIFPFVSETTKYGWLRNTVEPVYATTSTCVSLDPQRAAFPQGELSCHSYCKYSSSEVRCWPGDGHCQTSTSTTTTCVESLPSCLWYNQHWSGDELDPTSVCVPPKTPTSGGCSWLTYQSPYYWKTETWPVTSTCLYADAIPSCIYTYGDKCVPLQEASTKGPPSSKSGPTSTVEVIPTETKSSVTLSAAPAGRGEGGCTWRIPEAHIDHRECWIKDTEVDEWMPATRSSNGCSWFTSFATKTSAGKTTISLTSTCKPTPTVTWSLTTVLTETMVTFGSTSSTMTKKTMTRPVTSGKPSATASARRGDSQIHIDLDSSILDQGLKDANNLCAHREPIDGRRLNCDLMPQWARVEFEQLIEEHLTNRINDNALEFTRNGYMDQWIFDNATLRNKFITYGAGRQMIYNITHALALEENFIIEPDVMIEINLEMREDYPQAVDDDEEDTQEEAPRYKLVCALSQGTPMPSEDVTAMTSYLASYFDNMFPTPTTKPTCIPVEAGGIGQYVCQCSLASQTGEFPTTRKTVTATVSGKTTQKIDVCDYSSWPKTTAPPKTSDPPYPVPSDQKVSTDAMTCNDPKSAGYYGVQTVADMAQALYRQAFSSGLYAKPTGSSVKYSDNWNGFKVLKTEVRPYVEPPQAAGGAQMQNRWLVLSIQYLKTACGKGEEDKLVGFRNPSELNIEDFYDAFVMRSNPCNKNPDDEVGLEQWTPGGTINWKCLQWKLHSLDTPPSYKTDKHMQHWLNRTGSWNETTSGRSWNETSKERWGETGFEPRWTASAIGVGYKV